MTPLELATRLGQSPDLDNRITGVAIILRGLTDDDGDRQGWPMTPAVAIRAAKYIGVEPTPELVAAVLAFAPTLPDFYLNR
jgi:hypothetical protein